MISDSTEARMSEAVRNANAQNKRYPMLINIEDGRLMPNVPRLAGRPGNMARKEPAIPPHPKYRVYTGDLKATAEERLRWLETGGFRNHSAESIADLEPFDIGKATKEELLAFAANNYPDLKLDPSAHLTALRGQVQRASLAS